MLVYVYKVSSQKLKFYVNFARNTCASCFTTKLSEDNQCTLEEGGGDLDLAVGRHSNTLRH